jgi:hypothetical protein
MPSQPQRGVAFHFIGRGSPIHHRPSRLRVEVQTQTRMASYSRLLSAARRGCKFIKVGALIIVSLHQRPLSDIESPLEQFSPADGLGGGTCSPYHGQLEESGM